MLNIEILEEIGGEPVTLAEAKEYCRIDNDYTGEDDLINDLIKAARRAIEKYANISLVKKRIKVFSDTNKTLWLPYSPVIEIESVKDVNDNDIPYDGAIKFKVKINRSGEYFVTYTTGFTPLPTDLKLAVLKQVLTDYDNRENFTVSNNSTVRAGTNLANSAKNLAYPYSRNLLL